MTLKQQIQQGESLLQDNRKTLETIEILQQVKNDKKTLEFLLDMQKLDAEDRVKNIESRLTRLKQDYTVTFEKESAEVNLKLPAVVAECEKWIGKEPIAFTSKFAPLIASIQPYMDQEKKNDIYFELKGHLDFLKNNYRKA